MAEALAAWLALDAAKAVTKAVTARVLEEITLAWGFKDQLNILLNRFSDIQAFLEDLGSAKYVEKSNFVNLWLKKLTDVVYSADELMDDYDYELLRRKIELKNNHPSFKKKFSNFYSSATNPVVFRIRMSHRVQEILSKFDELDNEAMRNGIQKAPLAREAVASTTVGCYVDNEALHQNRKHAAATRSEFIGRKSDEKKLLHMILNSSTQEVNCLSTVVIVGIGGIGKTTIARRLYEHAKVDGHFDKKKVWICVSKDFNVDRLLNEMVEHLTSTKCDLKNTGAIKSKLQQQLKGKKFFLVLDDVWENNQDSWDSFKNALLSIGVLKRCVILITTRSIDIAEKANAFYQHKLPGLSEDEGWALLQQRVFTDTPPKYLFEDVGRRIVNKCSGVPLAIKAVGGLLQSKKHAYEWESIENSELWSFQPEYINDILPSLLLSYNHLNHVYVKQCFAYCAIFPKDYMMEKHQLITLWLAQGYLHNESVTSSSTSTLEMVGERYFSTLLNHSFLEEEKVCSKIRYKMHDLVHDLAAYVLKNDLLVWKVEIKLADVSHVRHLAFNLVDDETQSENFTSLRRSKLRTLCFWKNAPSSWNNSNLGCARYLRTLIMTGAELTEVPSNIGNLVHLRYLDLSNNEIHALPESICKLYQLQTLRLLGCYELRKLPKELHRLESLRHIETTTGSMLASRKLGKLTNLQTLPGLELLDGEGWTIDELGPLDQVKGQMKISGLEHVKNREAAREAGLARKDKITTLHLQWGGVDREAASQTTNNHCLYRFNIDEDVLDSLEPHPNLQTLIVQGFMGVGFPSWMMTMAVKQGGHSTPLTHLTQVELRSCSRCLQLPSFGQLPFLRILFLEKFDDLECIGEAFYQSRRNNSNARELRVIRTTEEKVLFGSLSELHIRSFERLTTWEPPSLIQGAILFPKLETLKIVNCPQLETIPCLKFQSLKHLSLVCVGGTQPLDIIKHSPCLKSLRVQEMKKMMMLPRELANCTKLEGLIVEACEKVKTIPNGLMSLTKLKILYCPLLACIPDGLSSLRNLTVTECARLERMPESLEESTSLEFMWIQKCPLIKCPIIPNLSKLQGLKQLYLVNVGELTTSSLQWIPKLHRLWYLRIGGYSRDEWDFSFTCPQSLRDLTLTDFPNVKSLPQQFLPTTLQYLTIEKFVKLKQVPEWIGNLSSLERLWLRDCKKLKYLPSKQTMLHISKLQHLGIVKCPLLKERCVEDDGPEWHKITHISNTYIE